MCALKWEEEVCSASNFPSTEELSPPNLDDRIVSGAAKSALHILAGSASLDDRIVSRTASGYLTVVATSASLHDSVIARTTEGSLHILAGAAPLNNAVVSATTSSHLTISTPTASLHDPVFSTTTTGYLAMPAALAPNLSDTLSGLLSGTGSRLPHSVEIGQEVHQKISEFSRKTGLGWANARAIPRREARLGWMGRIRRGRIKRDTVVDVDVLGY